MTTFKAKIGGDTKIILANSITDAYKRVEPYYKGQKIVITSARNRRSKPLFKKQWN